MPSTHTSNLNLEKPADGEQEGEWGTTINSNMELIDAAVATKTGAETLTNKTLTSPVLNTGVSGTAIKDEDDMTSNSASHLATQQSIKAYVDSQPASSLAADNLTVGDSAVTLSTTSGNITIDAQGSDTDIILKGTDGSSDTIFLTVDGSDGGTASFSHDVKLANDGSTLGFGSGNDVTVTHVHDSGLALKNTGTSASPATFVLQTGDTEVLVNDVLGKIQFQAPDEADSPDARLVSAEIAAVSEGTFTSANNTTKLSFKTAVSEAASEKMSLSSAGNLTVSGTYNGGGLMTTGGSIVIPNAGNIGSASDTDAMAISSGGVVSFSQVPTFPDDTIETADIQDNAVTLAKMAGLARGKIIYGDASGDPAALAVGSANTFLKTDGTDVSWASLSIPLDDIATGDAAATLATSAGNITVDAQGDNTDIIFKGTDGGADTTFLTLDGSEAGAATFNAGIVIANGGTIGSASDTDAMAIDANGIITKSAQPAFLVRPSSAQNNVTKGQTTTVVFGSEVYDQNADFASNTFTAPVTGKYLLNAEIRVDQIDIDTTYYGINIAASNRSVYHLKSTNQFDADPSYYNMGITVVMDMDAGDTAVVQIEISNDGADQTDISEFSHFSGYLLG